MKFMLSGYKFQNYLFSCAKALLDLEYWFSCSCLMSRLNLNTERIMFETP